MAKVSRTIVIDPEILQAAERYADQVVKESTNVVIQRWVREGLERAGAWPPPPKTKSRK